MNPIYHGAQLVRDCAFGTLSAADLTSAAVLAGFAALMWWLAVQGMRRRLTD